MYSSLGLEYSVLKKVPECAPFKAGAQSSPVAAIPFKHVHGSAGEQAGTAAAGKNVACSASTHGQASGQTA